MVSLFEPAGPTGSNINCGRHLQCNVQVSAFEGKIESCVFVFNKVQGDLKEVNGRPRHAAVHKPLGNLSVASTQ